MSIITNPEAQILLTGGTGFFGRSLLRYLISNRSRPSCKIFVLSRNPVRFLAQYPEFSGHFSINFLRGDIEKRDSLPWSGHFTHVIHAATDSKSSSGLTPVMRFRQIVDGTSHLLDLAVATGARRFLLTSSGGIYGPQPSHLDVIPEDWPGSPPLTEPSSAYSQGKRAAEHLCSLASHEHGIETVVARCFAFVGSDLPLDEHFAIGNFIRDALSFNPITIHGDGTPLRSYLHQRDLAHWLFTLLEHGKAGHAYNVGSNEAISILDLAFLVRDILSPQKKVEVLGTSAVGSPRIRYLPDISKVYRHMNLSVTISLTDAIKEFCVFK